MHFFSEYLSVTLIGEIFQPVENGDVIIVHAATSAERNSRADERVYFQLCFIRYTTPCHNHNRVFHNESESRMAWCHRGLQTAYDISGCWRREAELNE